MILDKHIYVCYKESNNYSDRDDKGKTITEFSY